MSRSLPQSTWLRLLVVTSAIVGVGACASESSEPPLGPRLEVGDMAGFKLPLDAYIASPVGEVIEAENVLVNTCMAEFGLAGKYLDAYLPDTGPPPNERRYWLVKASDAATLGYESPWADVVRKKLESTHDWSPFEEALLIGNGPTIHEGRQIPDGGCLGAARRQLAQGTPELPKMDGAPVLEDRSGTSTSMIADYLAGKTHKDMLNDSRVTSAVDGWRTCMADLGFAYESPRDANNDPKWDGDSASAEEIATATADVTCKRQVDLASTMATVETAYQNRALAENQEALDTIEQANTIRSNNALSVLENG